MNDDSVEQFWSGKEAQLGCKMILSTFAVYHEGIPGIESGTDGLLYLMENGFYFETFEPKTTLFSFLSFNTKKKFEKINVRLTIESITDVTEPGAGEKHETPDPIRRIKRFFTPRAFRRLLIRYVTNNGETSDAVFETLTEPSEIRVKYRSLGK